MARFPIDRFIEAFAARLVERGVRSIPLNENRTRDNLLRIYEFLEDEIRTAREKTPVEEDWVNSLHNIRNLFRPSPIGAFDDFEALMRSQQDYITEHPNPYYHDIVLRLPVASARRILSLLAPDKSELIRQIVNAYADETIYG